MSDDPNPCQKCGQPHPKCAAHKRNGQPCGQWPVTGQRVCKMHGGLSPQNLKAAQRRIQLSEAQKAVAKLNLRREIPPHQALLEEVYRTAGIVAWLDQHVQAIAPEDMVWGVTQQVEKKASEFPGTDTTEAAELNIWIAWWQQERDRLVKVSKAAVEAGIEERRIQLAEAQGALVADVIKRIGEAMLKALLAAGMPDQYESVFRDTLRDVAPRELRALSRGTGDDDAEDSA